MIYTIENDRLRAAVSSRGAELRSVLFKPAGKEQLWQRERGVWQDSAPWLFPIVGQLKGGSYVYRGREYALPIHGFAAYREFTLIRQKSTLLEFLLTDCAGSRAQYPFAFSLRIRYQISVDRLLIRATVGNPGREELLFSIGAHPGFLCTSGDRLELSRELPVRRLGAADHLLLPAEGERAGPCIRLEEALFERDAMIFEAPRLTGITLRRQDGTGIRMGFGRVPWLGLWSRTGADSATFASSRGLGWMTRRSRIGS